MRAPTSRFLLLAATLAALWSVPAGAQNDEIRPVAPIDLDRWPDCRHEVVLPPAWAFGVLYGGYTDQEGSLEKIRRIIDAGFPIDAYWIDSWFWDYENEGDGPDGYIDFTGDRGHYPDPAAMWGEMQELGIKGGVWVWDRILRDGNEEVWSDFDGRGFLTRHWVMKVTWHTDGQSPAAFVDFDNTKAAAYWQERLSPLFDMGLDFLKIDAGATLPYMKAAYEATTRYGGETRGRGFILSHANMEQDPPHLGGDPGVYRYPAKWTGDAAAQWSQENYPDLRSYRLGGLKDQIRIFATRDDKGHYPFLTMDTGGYSHGEITDELFTRWSQFSAFTPVMQVFGAPSQRESNSPYNFDEATQESFRTHTRLRMRLFPYIYSYAHLSRLTSENIIRPIRFRDDQYFFGKELIVAPIYKPGAERRYVYLPKGVWIDFWTGERHDQGWLGTTRRIEVSADRLPLFVRDGAIIPMREYARSIGLGDNDPLTLHVWASGSSRFTLIEDDGVSNDYLRGRVALTEIRAHSRDGGVRVVIDPVESSYEGMAEARTVSVRLRDFAADSAIIEGTPADVERTRDPETGETSSTVVATFDLAEGVVIDVAGRRLDGATP